MSSASLIIFSCLDTTSPVGSIVPLGSLPYQGHSFVIRHFYLLLIFLHRYHMACHSSNVGSFISDTFESTRLCLPVGKIVSLGSIPSFDKHFISFIISNSETSEHRLRLYQLLASSTMSSTD